MFFMSEATKRPKKMSEDVRERRIESSRRDQRGGAGQTTKAT